MTAYTIKDVAVMLQVHPDTVKKQINSGKLKAKKVGTEWRIPEPFLTEYLEIAANDFKTEREVALEKEIEELKKENKKLNRVVENVRNDLLLLVV